VSLPVRQYVGGIAGKDENSVKITDCDDAPEPAGESGPAGASGASRRRLLSQGMVGAGGKAIAIEFLVKFDNAEEALKFVEAIKAAKDEDLMSHLKDSGIAGVTGAGVLDSTIKGPTTTTTTTTTTAPPVGHGPCGITYSWPVIGDEEIDKQAELVAEWSARAMCRIDQEKNATAAVKGTRQEVLDFASSAMATTGDAIDAKGEPGDVVIRHLEKSQDDTITAKEKRRQLKVLKDYRKAVSVKRKAATNKRDASIAELLRLKVLRINTAKALWMTLKNKLAELNELLMKRLEIAAKDAAGAKKSEVEREPKAAVIAKFEASERAQAAARHVKVYANAVEYKASCAEALMHEWECKVLINCTVPEKAKEEEKPLWSTPTLDALNDKMMESITEYKSAKESVPAVPPKPKPEKPGPVETRIMELEKKYGTGDFAPGVQGGACKLEGNRVGHFVKGSCVPFEEEKKALKEQAKAIAAEEAKQAAAKKGGESGASGAAEEGASEEAAPKKKDAFAAIEKRIIDLEKTMGKR
jgi:hypothetical protein